MEFLKSERLYFRHWRSEDLPLASALWGQPEVMRYIDVRGGLNHAPTGMQHPSYEWKGWPQ